MEMLTRGKRALKASLQKEQKEKTVPKRISPFQDAKFWCDIGLDKDGFERKFISDEIGHGLFATRGFETGQFLLEYVGERISKKEAALRDRRDEKQHSKRYPRCYIFNFRFNGKLNCIDAKNHTDRLCRYANDAPKTETECNAVMKMKVFNNYPRLCLFALRAIKAGDEIRYDYGEDEKSLVWRKKKRHAPEENTDSDIDSNPFDLPQSESEFVQDSEDDSQHGFTDTDMSDANDPTYKPRESDVSGMSGSSFSDIIPDTSESCRTIYNHGLVLGRADPYISKRHRRNPKVQRIADVRSAAKAVLDDNRSDDRTLTEPVVQDVLEKQANASAIGQIEMELSYSPEQPLELDVYGVSSSNRENIPSVNHEVSREETKITPRIQTEQTTIDMKQVSSSPAVLDNKRSDVRTLTEPVVQDVLEKEANATAIEHIDIELSNSSEQPLRLGLNDMYSNNRENISSVTHGISVEDNKILPRIQTELTAVDIKEVSSSPGTYTLWLSRKSGLTNEAIKQQQIQACDEQEISEKNNPLTPEKQAERTPVIVKEVSLSPDLMCDTCGKKFRKRGAMTTHLKSHQNEKADYKRPSRVCPFCKTLTFHTQLPRHIRKKHDDIPEVAMAIALPENSKERNEYFEKFRKQGIFKYNQAQSALEEPNYLAERKNQTDLICCSSCKGFYGRQLFHRHKANCTKDKTSEPVAIHLDVFNNRTDEFSEVVLSCFRRDEIGDTCRTDPTIALIGRRLFQATNKKPESMQETRKTVMNDMRLLARLFLAVKSIVHCDTAEAMFLRKNFPALEQAIDTITREDSKLKHGVKNKIFYLLDSSREILVGHYYSLNMDAKAEEFEKFQKLLDLNKSVIFGDAIYAVHMNRQKKLRMPEQMADEEDVKKLRQYICNTITHYTSDLTFMGPHEYIKVRDSICARVTLFNARRGGEPARLRLDQYDDIKSERWVNSKQKKKLDEWEKKLFKEMEVTYQSGKGDHLVTDFIPLDCRKGLDILADVDVRHKAGVHDRNNYLFPNTQKSGYHVIGWSAIQNMCEEAGVENPKLLTATKQRHRISTIYSALDVPEADRQYFYKHMGHSKEVNLGTYQYPLPVLAVTKVGRHLQEFDKALSADANDTTATCTNTSGIPALGEQLDEESSQNLTELLTEANDTTATCTYTSDFPALGEQLDEGRSPDLTELSHERNITSASLTSDKTPPEEHIEINDITSSSCNQQNNPTTSIQTTPKIAASREYFKWTPEETFQIKSDFHEWIYISDGNPLPSKRDLVDYISAKQCRYNFKQLKTKIMNEQNKQQSISKKRMKKMLDEN